ncbi:MAG: TRAP transporter small permease [Deltaproteobacteria bacterium]|nr:TRAP transporter small permease [Deltaproteobacteria bacterium]MBW1978425.1 TRAP transporter small permease [Deltaproteobacteria bacterium]MBW2046245.1 TRAP transporter small permease [Deltaproteobacteria bacterium]MBW2299212.1 TRAP transporter small permease [Deltaproteobacteria bacterium]
MGKIMEKLLKVFSVLAGLLLLFITITVAYTIFARFFGIPGPVWVVQFSEYSMLWMTLLGAAWVLKKGKHVSVDLVTGRLKTNTRRGLNLAHAIMGVAVCGSLCWYGAVVAWGQYQRGVTDIQVVDMPKCMILVIIPAGFLFLALQFLQNFVTGLKQLKKGGAKSALLKGSAAPLESDHRANSAGGGKK